MNLSGRRESNNVDDRRGQRNVGGMSGGSGGGLNLLSVLFQLFMSSKGSGSGGGKKGSGCLILLVVVGVLAFSYCGGGSLIPSAGLSDESGYQQEQYQGSDQEEELAKFSKQILAGTEDVWTKLFAQMGRTYEPPRLVLFTDMVQSGCGGATSSSGPFYCSADQTVYIDLSFFINMKRQIGADGDFAYAYVIAHEVGHHVQYLLGDLNKVHSQMSRVSKTESNQLSVRLELQADFYAGIWAYYDNKMFRSLEDGDIDEGLDAARKIGDDYLQRQAQGYTVPESFNHGTSAQRSKWLKLGATTGNIRLGDTFSPSYNEL
ncbi:MAG: neutral zinc metallopeptidase [Bacteroidales bacterium]|nr:neutral zinc metallopeptidase [Candidatus Liminaster caballi]